MNLEQAKIIRQICGTAESQSKTQAGMREAFYEYLRAAEKFSVIEKFRQEALDILQRTPQISFKLTHDIHSDFTVTEIVPNTGSLGMRIMFFVRWAASDPMLQLVFSSDIVVHIDQQNLQSFVDKFSTPREKDVRHMVEHYEKQLLETTIEEAVPSDVVKL